MGQPAEPSSALMHACWRPTKDDFYWQLAGRRPARPTTCSCGPAEAMNDPARIAFACARIVVNKTRLRNALCARHNHVDRHRPDWGVGQRKIHAPPPHPAKPQVLAVRVFFILLTIDEIKLLEISRQHLLCDSATTTRVTWQGRRQTHGPVLAQMIPWHVMLCYATVTTPRRTASN